MRSEILAPGGSLDHALWALEGGADAVYIGFQKFSARSHANNLSLDEIAALTPLARAKGARVFCALNTILGADEVAEAVALSWELHFRGVDAFIVQDLGLALALVRHGPPVALHASTQAAVHNAGGVAAMKTLGFRRVVLARELTMAEIATITASDPSMEYEVFVHGALCYAVSGNCMASGLMLGRSANRGDCGQVCRTKFELDYLIPGPKRRTSPHEEGAAEGVHAAPGETTWKPGTVGAFASMNDLELGPRIRELAALGVHSFKIEGRMKPPAYAYNTARAYKAFLTGGHDHEAWGWLDEARLRFGRLPSAGWLDGHKALAQTNPSWPGSLGLPLGVVSSGSEVTLKVPLGSKESVLRSLAKGDGIMVLGPGVGQSFRAALADHPAVSGAEASISLADRLPFDPRGGTLWLLSRHDGKLPVKKAARPWRHPIPVQLSVEATGPGRAHLTALTPAMGGLTMEEDFDSEPARSVDGLALSLKEIFTASDSPFGPGDLTISGPENLFLQPKALKEFRRRWYAEVESRAQGFLGGLAERVRASAPGPHHGPAVARSGLSPLEGVQRLLGFVTDWESLVPGQLAPTPWGLALPLAPFTPNEESYFRRFRDFLVRNRDQTDIRFLVGLNNPCHLTWIKRLRSEGLHLEAWFADWGFHGANPWTPEVLAAALPGMAFFIRWLEDPENPDRSYFPPLFTSRACMLRNSFGSHDTGPTPGSLGFDSRTWAAARQSGQVPLRPAQGPRCPDGCAGQFSARLVQGKQPFRVEARDCINYLIHGG